MSMDYRKARTDRRVLYTKMFLRESLLELMREKPIGKITPTELCRRADINRNTFYAHYDSPEALLASVEDELYDQINRSLAESLQSGNIFAMLTEICHLIRKNGNLCKVLFSDHGDKEFLRRIVGIARDRCMAEWRVLGMTEDGQMEMLYRYTASGIVAVIEQWIQGDMNTSPEELARFIAKAAAYSQQAFLK
jgi:AcrR family transcriptional regulator